MAVACTLSGFKLVASRGFLDKWGYSESMGLTLSAGYYHLHYLILKVDMGAFQSGVSVL